MATRARTRAEAWQKEAVIDHHGGYVSRAECMCTLPYCRHHPDGSCTLPFDVLHFVLATSPEGKDRVHWVCAQCRQEIQDRLELERLRYEAAKAQQKK